MPDNDIKTTSSNRDTPPMRTPKGDSQRSEKVVPAGDDSAEAPVNPKTSGASARNAGLSRSNVADRNKQGPREAGVTPRPTDDAGGL